MLSKPPLFESVEILPVLLLFWILVLALCGSGPLAEFALLLVVGLVGLSIILTQFDGPNQGPGGSQ